MQELIEALRAMIAGLWEESLLYSTRFARVALINPEMGERPEEFYFRGLRRLGWFVILTPIPLLIVGIFASAPALTAFVGLVWGFFTVLFAFAGAPFAAFVESLAGTAESGIVNVVKKGTLKISVEKYLSFVKSALLAEMVLSLFLSVFPVKNNPGMFLVVLVAAIVLGLLGGSGNKGKKYVTLLAGLVMAFGIISFTLPKSFSMMQGWREKIDDTVAPAINPGNSLTPPEATPRTSVDEPNQYDPMAISNFDFNGQSITFGYRDTAKTIELRPNEWSPRIYLNRGNASFFIGDPADTTVAWFKDGARFTLIPGGKVDFGMRRGIFRLLGKSPVVVGYSQ